MEALRSSSRHRLVHLGSLLLAVVVGVACDDRAQPIDELTVHVPGQPPKAVRVPVRLDAAAHLPSRRLWYRLEAQATVAPALVGEELLLVMPSLFANVRARGDGQPLAEAQRSDGQRGRRHRPPLAWTVPGQLSRDGHLDLELEVEHTTLQTAWIFTAPRLLPAQSGLGRAWWVDLANHGLSVACIVSLLTVGLSLLWMYAIDRSRTAARLVAWEVITALTYPCFIVGLLAPLGRWEYPIVLSGLVATTVLGIHFSRAFFGLPPPSVWWGRVAAAIVAYLVIDPDPFRVSRLGVQLGVAFIGVTLGYILTTSVARIRERRSRESWLFFLAFAIAAIFAGPDMLYWLGIAEVGDGARFGQVGLVIFPLVLGLLLNEQHIGTLANANQLLAARVGDLERQRAEIEQLNLELRRQVNDRAAQIYAALALAHAQGRSTPNLAEGELVQGRYRIARAIGAGGMGTVYEVVRLSDGRRLALKVAREVHGEALARLAREAQTASTAAHPHVVAIVDVDVATSGFLFLVMELVDGEPLSKARAHFGERAWALDVLAQLADGLSALHAAGVVHRDLKPGNVLLTGLPDGRPSVKITDFGISLMVDETSGSLEGHADTDTAKSSPPADTANGAPLAEATPTAPATRALAVPVAEADRPSTPMEPSRPALPSLTNEATSATVASPPGNAALGARAGQARGKRLAGRHDSGPLTRTGVLPGTPSYIAPELATGRHHLSVAADVFAFGVIAHELLAGRRPFGEPPVLALLERRAPAKPTSLAERCPGLPTDLTRLLDACLAYAPELRPSAAELKVALHAAAAAHPRAPKGGTPPPRPDSVDP
jgi:serine/threonine-protein kinase